MADNFFSIEFGERFIKIIDIKKSGDLYEINYIGKIEIIKNFYTSDLEKIIEEQAELIRKFIDTLGINKRNVVASINNNLAYHQIIEMPVLKEKELISAIKYQADQFIPMPIDEVNIDLEIIKEDEKNKKMFILVVAASKKVIEKIQNTIEASGLIPNAIETKLSSSARFVNYFYKNILNNYPECSDLVLIDFDYFSSNFSYFEESPFIIKKIHNISFGYNLFLKEISVNLDLDEKKSADLLKNYRSDNDSSYQIEKIINPLLKEFILEINRFIISKKPSLIFFTNEIINFPELIFLLKKQLDNIDLKILNPSLFLKKNSLTEAVLHEIPLYFSVIGTNLR